jgi:hypothetical protein
MQEKVPSASPGAAGLPQARDCCLPGFGLSALASPAHLRLCLIVSYFGKQLTASQTSRLARLRVEDVDSTLKLHFLKL